MKYYSIMEHHPQCKETQTLNLEGKKNPSLMKQSTWPNKVTVFSTRNVSTQFRSTIWLYQPNTSQEPTCSFIHLCKPAHNVNLLLEQWQQIIPKLWE